MIKTLGKKVKHLFEREDRGVSPVIGVILMVAITVILAAVIGAFVLGLGDEMDTGVQAGATISQSGDSATVTWNSGGNAERIAVNAGSGSFEGSPETNEEGYATIASVGDTVTVTGNDDVTITVIAYDENDNSSVIAQETVTFSSA